MSRPGVSQRLQIHVVGFLVGAIGFSVLGVAFIFAMFPGASQGFERTVCAIPLLALSIAGVLGAVGRIEAIERKDKAKREKMPPGTHAAPG